MMAIVWAIKRYRPYLEGKKFILRTDSKVVSWFNNFKEEKSKLVRWSLLLQEFDFKLQHVADKHNELPETYMKKLLKVPKIRNVCFPQTVLSQTTHQNAH